MPSSSKSFFFLHCDLISYKFTENKIFHNFLVNSEFPRLKFYLQWVKCDVFSNENILNKWFHEKKMCERKLNNVHLNY